jgi:hypothetical protein
VMDPTTVVAFRQPNCCMSGAGGCATLGIPCRLGQDQPVDCSLCLGNPLCNP